jgi:hypothetical protein
MSADFEKVLVKDPRLDVSESIKYAVIKGGQNVTCAPYGAISQTNNQLVFNIQVPSEQTILDRRVLLQTVLQLKVTTKCAWTAAGEVRVVTYPNGRGCYYGVYAALASFPLHQLMTVLSATINNNTVSINIRDVLPAIIRMLACEDLVCWNGSSPTFRDTFASYSPTVVGRNAAHPNSNYWAIDDASIVHRGSFVPIGYSATGAAPDTGASGVVDVVETFAWQLTEPLLLSPFIFTNLKNNGQGFYGIQNLNIVINIGDTRRVFRGLTGYNPTGGLQSLAPSYYNPSPAIGTDAGAETAINSIYSVEGGGTNGELFSQTKLLFNFLTPHPSDLLPARNIVPFYELPRYITSQAPTLVAAAAQSTGVSGNSFGARGGEFSVETNSLQLNQIPDKLIIFVRKTASKQSWGDADVAYPIDTISINFNNNSGILASAKQVDLWQFSRNNGCNGTWNDWTGNGVVPNFTANTNFCPLLSNGVKSAALPGSYLVLEFGKDIQLTEDFYAAGSLGNFNIQVKLNCYNNNVYGLSDNAGEFGVVGNNLDLVLITMNSGVFVCERGTSSTYTGILTKQDVLEASQQDHYTHDDVKRLVGGGIFDMIKSGVSKLASKGKEMAMTHGKDLLKKHGKKLLNKGKEMAMSKGKEMLSKYMGPDE